MEESMRVIFVGTSEFGIPALKALAEHHEIPLVVSQPDRPRGRGKKLLPTPIKSAALELGLRVIQPERIKDAEEEIKQAEPDVLVVASYGQIIPKGILEIPKLAPLNIHPSLLPKYRGAAPIQRAIMNGERETGVTIMWMNERLDAGDILLQERVPIGGDETYGELHQKLSELSASLILKTLELLEEGKIERTPQKEEEASYAKPIDKSETVISWEEPAEKIHNLIRALSPKPGASGTISGQRFKIYRTKPGKGKGTPGSIIKKDIKKGILEIACGEGSLFILEIQPEGKKIMDVASFLRGYGHKL